MVICDRQAKNSLAHGGVLQERFDPVEKVVGNAHALEIEHLYPLGQGETYPMPKVAFQGIIPHMSMSPIQRNFQAVMKEKGLNMRSWAIKAGLPETRVKAVMQGKSQNPRADTLSALAKAAGVPVSRLVGQSLPNVDAQVGGNLKYELLDQQLFDLCAGLSLDAKLATVTILRELIKLAPRKVG